MTRRRTSFAISLAILGVMTPLAGATAPGKNGRIAFVRLGLGGDAQASAIVVANADGSGEKQITQPAAGDRDDAPDWSRDGRRIVFQRCGPGGGACVVMATNPDGTGLKRLSAPCPAAQAAPACVDDRAPVYSPDGRQIAFVRATPRAALMVADAKLRHARRLIGRSYAFRGSPSAVAWSPSGKQLAFAVVNEIGSGALPVNGRALWVIGVDGNGVRRLTPWSLEAGGRPDWSPDGSRILFRSASKRVGGFGVDLYTVRPDGSGLRPVTHVSDSERVFGGSYSPDGRSIVLSTTAAAIQPTQGLPDLAVVRADGTGARPVTRSDSWDVSPDWGPRR